MKLTIGIFFGGKSVEHDISILSAIQVMNAIDRNKYEIIPIYLDKLNNMYTSKTLGNLKTYKTPNFIKKLHSIWMYKSTKGVFIQYTKQKFKKQRKISLVLPIVHGEGMEDGTIAGFLQMYDIPFITPDVKQAALAQDKEWTKIILKYHKIPVISWIKLHKLKQRAIEDKDFPLIIKPATLGSSIGIKLVYNKEELEEGIKEANKYTSKLIVEKALIDFKEYNMACFKIANEYFFSQIEEVKCDTWYDFTSKYEQYQKEQMPRLILKEEQYSSLYKKIKYISKKVYQILELHGIIRIDFLYDQQTKQLYVNEVNTIPGSLSFYLFDNKQNNNSLNFTDMLNLLIKDALLRMEQNKKRITSFESNVLFNSKLNQKK